MTIRKYRKQVNRNGWMRKLQLFTFGKKTPDFVGYCPFFWFTWLSLIVLPFVLVLRVITLPIALVVHYWPESGPKRPSKTRLVLFYDFFQRYGTVQGVIDNTEPQGWCDDIVKWIIATPDWENCARDAIAKRDRAAIRDEISKVKNNKRAAKLAVYGPYIAKTAAFVGAVLGIILGTKAVIFILPFITVPRLWIVLDAVAVLLGVGLIGVLLALLLERVIIPYFKRCPKCPGKVGIFRKIGGVIYSGLEFICETIDTIYTSECPLIKWSDSSEPIERNE